MRYLLTAETMKAADQYTMKVKKMPSLVLMERAALKAVEVMEKKDIDFSSPLVVCGGGNNGGDGFAIARMLQLKGYPVTALFAGKMDRRSPETALQMDIARSYGVSIVREMPNKPYSVVIDALFGIGLTRPLDNEMETIIEKMNTLSCKKVAIDIPSGIHAMTGEVMEIAFRADFTVTFAYEKVGTVLYPGKKFAGNVYVQDIGIYLHNDIPGERFYTYDTKDIKQLCPKRDEDSHKGTYGKVLIIAGSKGMSGAAYLSAKAAYAVGAGLVQIMTAEENRTVLQELLPEAILTTYKSEFEGIPGSRKLMQERHTLMQSLKKALQWADVVCIGPGIGINNVSRVLLRETLKLIDKPCIVDADGLNLLSRDRQKEDLLEEKGVYLILTPHVKELSRLVNLDVAVTKRQRIPLAKKLAEKYQLTCVAKDTRTVVASQKPACYLNTSGSAAMAKAGSGDVLAGMIAGFVAQKMKNTAAAELGVYIHGLCGCVAKHRKGPYSVLAGDLIDSISVILKN